MWAAFFSLFLYYLYFLVYWRFLETHKAQVCSASEIYNKKINIKEKPLEKRQKLWKTWRPNILNILNIFNIWQTNFLFSLLLKLRYLTARGRLLPITLFINFPKKNPHLEYHFPTTYIPRRSITCWNLENASSVVNWNLEIPVVGKAHTILDKARQNPIKSHKNVENQKKSEKPSFFISYSFILCHINMNSEHREFLAENLKTQWSLTSAKTEKVYESTIKQKIFPCFVQELHSNWFKKVMLFTLW